MGSGLYIALLCSFFLVHVLGFCYLASIVSSSLGVFSYVLPLPPCMQRPFDFFLDARQSVESFIDIWSFLTREATVSLHRSRHSRTTRRVLGMGCTRILVTRAILLSPRGQGRMRRAGSLTERSD